MKYKVYLDDERTPNDKSWVIVRNYGQFIKMISKSIIKFDQIKIIRYSDIFFI